MPPPPIEVTRGSCKVVRVRTPTSRAGRVEAIALYAGVALLSLAVAAMTLGPGVTDLRVPYRYGGDASFFGMEVKAVADNGWCLTVPQLGAPGVLEMHDFPPQFDALHLGTIRLMSALTGDWAVLFNLYFLLGFPIIAFSALAVLRHFRVSWAPAAVVSLLYAFLPSRLIKGQGHIFLDTFYQVPLAILVALWVSGESPPLTREPGPGRWPGLEIRGPRAAAALLICVVVGLASLYYAYFTMWLLVVAAIGGSVARRSLRNVVSGVALAAVVGGTVGVLGLPTVGYEIRHGPNKGVIQRVSGEAEVNGMRVAQLLLPIDDHPLPALRRLKQEYARTAPLPGESSATSLGAVGAVGFLGLLGFLLWSRRAGPRREEDELLTPLASLTLAAVLIGSIGGFGSLFAVLVSPVFRSYCRISVFISFLSLFALALALDRLWRGRRKVAWVVLPAILVLGLWDQGALRMRPADVRTRTRYANDADLVAQIERAVPANAMIYQLPFVPFPEALRVGRVDPYDSLEPYLHARSLRWSFGAMHGREGEPWIQEAARLAPAELVRQTARAGFAGILIDRRGYADDARALEADLMGQVKEAPIVSADGRRAFFKLPLP